MTTYYVGSGGNNANAGTSWAQRKLTLNGAEDIPVAAGDTVYVGPGTYREGLTVDISGSGGSPITYIGDYTGANTDGVGGVVRITTSDNDQTAARTDTIAAVGKNYRTFRGFCLDASSTASAGLINTSSGCTNWTIEDCFIGQTSHSSIGILGTTSAWTIRRCYIIGGSSSSNNIINFQHSSTVSDAGHVVENCIIISGAAGRCVGSTRVGGITVRNCFLFGGGNGVRVDTALAVGQTITVNNCIIVYSNVGLQGTVVGEITENYNNVYQCSTARTNVTAGANSLAYPPLLDPRWFFELVTNGAGPSSVTQLLTPFDLASYSQLLNVAGTSPTTTDMRGTAVQGSQREWGALEYDSTLKIEGSAGGIANSIFGGMVR